jgi:hypothetical protein
MPTLGASEAAKTLVTGHQRQAEPIASSARLYYGIDVGFGDGGEVGCPWEVLAQQGVGVLVGAALPGACVDPLASRELR